MSMERKSRENQSRERKENENNQYRTRGKEQKKNYTENFPFEFEFSRKNSEWKKKIGKAFRRKCCFAVNEFSLLFSRDNERWAISWECGGEMRSRKCLSLGNLRSTWDRKSFSISKRNRIERIFFGRLRPKWQQNMKITFPLSVHPSRRNFYITHIFPQQFSPQRGEKKNILERLKLNSAFYVFAIHKRLFWLHQATGWVPLRCR